MARIFWDTMLFIYLLEDNKDFAPQVRQLLESSYRRDDFLLTSHLALGEVMAGGKGTGKKGDEAREILAEMEFTFVPFQESCVKTFSILRSEQRLGAQDSMNLASAAAVGVDMFLTNDTQLLKRGLYVPGIHFISDFTKTIL